MIASAAWIVAGIALWFSRSVLDVFKEAGRTARVAMFPSVPELFGLIVLMLLMAAGVVTCVRRWTSSDDARAEAFLQISLPLFGLILIIAPYLPWLPDEIDPIRSLAGPVVRIIWLVIVAQVILTFFSVRSALRQVPIRKSRGIVGAAIVLVVTAALTSFAFVRLRDTFAGVALASEHPAFFSSSFHAAWIAIALASVMAVMTWRWVFAFTEFTAAATFAWVAVFLGAPFFFASISSYPEVPAAFCVMVAVAWRTTPQQRDASWLEYLIRGIAISVLPWLSVTYIPMAVTIALLLAFRAVRNPKTVLAVMVPFTISVVGRVALSHQSLQFGNPIVGLSGLLFDQELGILIYAPALALGFVGLWQMVFARDAMVRQRGRELAAVFGVLLLSASALENWWQTVAPPGRALGPALPLLGLPMAWAYLGAPEHSVRRSVYQVLAVIGVAVTLAMTLAEHGLLVVQDRNGSARFLQWLTVLWPAWSVAPAIAAKGLRTSGGLIALWIAAALTVAWISRRNPSQQPGVSALMATVNLSAAIAVVALLVPAIGRAEPPSVSEPEARSRLPILDNFDSVARPHAIIYRPFTVAHASDIPPLMTLAAVPGLRTGSQPLHVLLNARYALAAGDYALEIGGLRNSETLQGWVGLQVGRIGGPLQQWQVELAPGATWRGEFSLPVDAEFVGFVVSDALSSAASLRLTPLRIVNRNNRESSSHGSFRTVLSAIHAPSGSIFFHDENVYPERHGFWVHGQSTSYMTVAANKPDRGVTLRAHSGAMPNTLTLATPTWGERVALLAGTPRDVHVPAPARPGPFLLRVTAESGFVPAAVIPGNTDRRILGCWIEIVQE